MTMIKMMMMTTHPTDRPSSYSYPKCDDYDDDDDDKDEDSDHDHTAPRVAHSYSKCACLPSSIVLMTPGFIHLANTPSTV